MRPKVIVFGQSGFNRARRFFPRMCLYLGKSGCIRAKLLYSGKIGCIWAKCCIRTKVVVFGQSVYIRQE